MCALLCVCVCMCARVCVCTPLYAPIYINQSAEHTQRHTHIHTNIRTKTLGGAHTDTDTNADINTQRNTHKHTYTDTDTNTDTDTHTSNTNTDTDTDIKHSAERTHTHTRKYITHLIEQPVPIRFVHKPVVKHTQRLVHPEPFVEGGGLHTAASGKGCLGQHHDTLRVIRGRRLKVCVHDLVVQLISRRYLKFSFESVSFVQSQSYHPNLYHLYRV